jgi:branched-chain amino acid transport system permease protein
VNDATSLREPTVPEAAAQPGNPQGRTVDLWRVASPQLATDAVVWLLLLTMPWWLTALGGYTALATRVVVMGLAAMSLNFLLGYTGVLSFGHAAYFGLAAYGTGLTLKLLAPSTPLAVLDGVMLGTAAAAIVGALISRLRGVYYAMVTIAFGQIFYFVAFRWNSLTGGDDGLSGWQRQPIDLGFARIDIAGNDLALYFVALALFGLCVAAMAMLLRSPFGRSLVAIRENERRARFLGIAVERHVWLSWLISCMFVSVAGALYALLNNFADPHQLRWDQSGDFVIMAVLGGMRSFWGPLLGAAIFVVLQDFVSSHTQNWMSVIGLVFVLVVLFFPRGVLGLLRRRATGPSR